MLDFTKGLIAFTQEREIFKIEDLLASSEDIDEPHIAWHGIELNKPDWSKHSRSLAFTLFYPDANEVIHVMVNAYWKSLKFQIPDSKGKSWYKVVDTAASTPKDFSAVGKGEIISKKSIPIKDRSIIVLMAQ